jgi:hypothetical protein
VFLNNTVKPCPCNNPRRFCYVKLNTVDFRYGIRVRLRYTRFGLEGRNGYHRLLLRPRRKRRQNKQQGDHQLFHIRFLYTVVFIPQSAPEDTGTGRTFPGIRGTKYAIYGIKIRNTRYTYRGGG